jgi:DNA-binding NtrC family response regulator
MQMMEGEKKMEQAIPPKPYQSMPDTANQQTVLVVEDEAIIRMSTVAALEDAGYWVFEAQNSNQALEQLAQHTEISVLLTDVRMPGRMNGLALVSQVQRDYPAIRAIVMSAHTTAEEASDAGALGFVLKPYMPQTVIRAVRETVLRH